MYCDVRYSLAWQATKLPGPLTHGDVGMRIAEMQEAVAGRRDANFPRSAPSAHPSLADSFCFNGFAQRGSGADSGLRASMGP